MSVSQLISRPISTATAWSMPEFAFQTEMSGHRAERAPEPAVTPRDRAPIALNCVARLPPRIVAGPGEPLVSARTYAAGSSSSGDGPPRLAWTLTNDARCWPPVPPGPRKERSVVVIAVGRIGDPPVAGRAPTTSHKEDADISAGRGPTRTQAPSEMVQVAKGEPGRSSRRLPPSRRSSPKMRSGRPPPMDERLPIARGSSVLRASGGTSWGTQWGHGSSDERGGSMGGN